MHGGENVGTDPDEGRISVPGTERGGERERDQGLPPDMLGGR